MAFRGASRTTVVPALRRNLTRCFSTSRNCGFQINDGRPVVPSQDGAKALHNLVDSRALRPSPFAYKSTAQATLCFTRRRSDVTSCRERTDENDGSHSTDVVRSDIASEIQDSPTQSGDEALSGAEPSSVKVVVDPSFKASARHDLAMLFTCNVCGVRSAKTMSRATYETGVVIVRCPGCQNLHLIADRYGWFGDAGSVEDFLAEKGVSVRKGSDESYEFTTEDLAGWTPKGKPNP